MRLRATPAKINLYLAVHERLPDGYHEITSVFLPIPELSDRVGIAKTDNLGIAFECAHPSVPTDEHNLCIRAARSFADATGIVPAWRIVLDKQIPVAAGLGGGSSDAAATLLALNDFHHRPLDDARLQAVAGELGADVPFFLDPQPCVGTGTGQALEPVPQKARFGLVLVNPMFPISAGWAYKQWDARDPSPAAVEGMLEALQVGELNAVAQRMHNDLEVCAFRKFPLLSMLRDRMLAAGCLAVLMSGSGPTLFGVCRPDDAAATRNRLQPTLDFPAWVFDTVIEGTP